MECWIRETFKPPVTRTLSHQDPFLMRHGSQPTANRPPHLVASYDTQGGAEDVFYPDVPTGTEVVRAVRGCSAACIVMLGGNAIGDVDTSRIIQRLISLDTVMESHGTTMVFVEIPYRAANRYGILLQYAILYLYV